MVGELKKMGVAESNAPESVSPDALSLTDRLGICAV